MRFVNRERELVALKRWWDRPDAPMGLVWGRRRVGKTALLEHFANDRPTIFHTATARPRQDELRVLSMAAAPYGRLRDLAERPFANWDDVLDTLALAAESTPVLLVLDEFPELVEVSPELPSVMRAFWDRNRGQTHLKILLSGSAVRSMQALQEERAPLYGRFDLSLSVHPFGPHEASRMLPRLKPAERALVWGLIGGVPLYLQWWDQEKSIRDNLAELACRPDGRLLIEGDYVLATEGIPGDIARQVLYAIATGKTKHNEIATAVGTEPTRALESLAALRLVERLAPVTEDPRHTRRRVYRIADNFLAFWLGVLDRYRTQIDRGLSSSVVPVVLDSLDDFLGPRWEEAFRIHLIRLAESGALGDGIVAVGPFWSTGSHPAKIDAVALAGRSRVAVLAGEAKWAVRVDGPRIRRALEQKVGALPDVAPGLRYAVCARETVDDPGDMLVVTAADIFDS